MFRLLMFCVLGLIACREAPSLAHEGGDFALVSVDGQPLPAVRDSEARCVERVVAGHYTLQPTLDTAEAPYRLREHTVLRCGENVSLDSSAQAATYFVRRDTLRFRSHPKSFVMWRGVRRADTLLIRQDRFYADYIGRAHEYRYVRRPNAR